MKKLLLLHRSRKFEKVEEGSPHKSPGSPEALAEGHSSPPDALLPGQGGAGHGEQGGLDEVRNEQEPPHPRDRAWAGAWVSHCTPDPVWGLHKSLTCRSR